MEDISEQKKTGYGKRPLWHWLVIYAVIAVIVYGLFYYFVLAKKDGYNANQASQYQAATSQPQTAAQSSSTSASAMPSTAAVNKITVSGTEFAFSPSTITVKMGQSVAITFKNNGTYPHNLTISDLNVGTKTITPGQQDSFTFTPTKIGSFPFICTVPGHADKGMKGTLIVQ